MTATQESAHMPATTLGKSLRSGQMYGILTPEGTPAVEDGRIEAEKARLLNDHSQPEDLGVATQSKPPFENESDSDSDSGSEGDSSRVPSQEQKDMTQKVNALEKGQSRKIIGVAESYADPREEKEAVMNSFREQIMLLHPAVNKTKGADKACRKIYRAAKDLGVEKDDIKEMQFWDGEEEIEALHLNHDGKWVPASEYMEVEKTSGGFSPSSFHRAEYEAATPFLGRLMANPDDSVAIVKLNEANARMFEQDKKDGLSEEECGKYAINLSLFRSVFKRASESISALKQNPDDIEAREKFDLLNEELRQLNSKHHYPKAWTMDVPTKEVRQPAGAGKDTGNIPSRDFPSDVLPAEPKFRATARKAGFVQDSGKTKEIVGYRVAGFGCQLLLRHKGNNDLFIHELVAASKFGVGYGKSYMDQPGAQNLVLGDRKDLQGQNLDSISIAGVASVRRDPFKEPAGGWKRKAETIVLAGFGVNPAQNARWYARSVLGKVFGQAATDEELNAYRDEAGQERSLPPASLANMARNRNTESAEP